MSRMMPNKGSYTKSGGGEKEPSGTKITKGQGDLRGKPGKNAGKMSGTYGGK
jgi:hypothetical protein